MRTYDVLLTPTLPVPPFPLHIQGVEKIDGRIVQPFQWLTFTFPLNMTDQPAATIPAGFTQDGQPVGLQIIGHHLDDALTLRASAAFEQARPWADRRSAMFAEKASELCKAWLAPVHPQAHCPSARARKYD